VTEALKSSTSWLRESRPCPPPEGTLAPTAMQLRWSERDDRAAHPDPALACCPNKLRLAEAWDAPPHPDLRLKRRRTVDPCVRSSERKQACRRTSCEQAPACSSTFEISGMRLARPTRRILGIARNGQRAFWGVVCAARSCARRPPFQHLRHRTRCRRRPWPTPVVRA